MTMSKSIPLDAIEFMMLQELAKRIRQKPEQYLKTMIKSQYEALKR